MFICAGFCCLQESLQIADMPEIHDELIQTIDEDIKIEAILESKEMEDEIWQVEIPAIDLVAPISEGTTQEVMSKYVGHFESTNMWSGNIGLAAHNRRISNKLF